MSSFWQNSLFLYLRFLRRYHRFSVSGLDHVLSDNAQLITGYHGRGLPMDLGLVAHEIYRRKGYLAHAVMHRRFWDIPVLRAMVSGWGALPGDMPVTAEAIARGESFMITPGGTREAMRRFDDRYRVKFGRRRGYLRFALKYDLPLVPVGSWGVDERFIGLNDGHALAQRLGLPRDFPIWFGLGPLGIFPLTPPMPVRIHTAIGEPIDLRAATPLSPDSPEYLEDLNDVVTRRIQELIEEARVAHQDRSSRGVLS